MTLTEEQRRIIADYVSDAFERVRLIFESLPLPRDATMPTMSDITTAILQRGGDELLPTFRQYVAMRRADFEAAAAGIAPPSGGVALPPSGGVDAAAAAARARVETAKPPPSELADTSPLSADEAAKWEEVLERSKNQALRDFQNAKKILQAHKVWVPKTSWFKNLRECAKPECQREVLKSEGLA